MENLAAGKWVMEYCNHPDQMTNGKYKRSQYSGVDGYCGIHHPGYITIDLGDNKEIGAVRFLLWNQDDDINGGLLERKYYYRLMVAEAIDDKQPMESLTWQILFDSKQAGYRGWQQFTVAEDSPPVKGRYVRIHAVNNHKNNGFHVVELEAYSQKKFPRPYASEEDDHATADITLYTDDLILEDGDGFTLSKRLTDLGSIIYRSSKREGYKDCLQMKISEKHLPQLERNMSFEVNGTDKMAKLDADIIEKAIINFAHDIKILETNSDGIERVIISPLDNEFEKVGKKGSSATVWGLIAGIAAVIITVIVQFF